MAKSDISPLEIILAFIIALALSVVLFCLIAWGGLWCVNLLFGPLVPIRFWTVVAAGLLLWLIKLLMG